MNEVGATLRPAVGTGGWRTLNANLENRGTFPVAPGAATLGGTLNVSTFGGFVPTIGDTFTPMTCGSQTGGLATTNLPTVPLGTRAPSVGPAAYSLAVVP